MTTMVNVHEAKTHLSRLLERAVAGEDIVIAKAGKPMVKLTVVAEAKPQRVFGRLKGLRLSDAFFEPMSEEELALWEGK